MDDARDRHRFGLVEGIRGLAAEILNDVEAVSKGRDVYAKRTRTVALIDEAEALLRLARKLDRIYYRSVVRAEMRREIDEGRYEDELHGL